MCMHRVLHHLCLLCLSQQNCVFVTSIKHNQYIHRTWAGTQTTSHLQEPQAPCQHQPRAHAQATVAAQQRQGAVVVARRGLVVAAAASLRRGRVVAAVRSRRSQRRLCGRQGAAAAGGWGKHRTTRCVVVGGGAFVGLCVVLHRLTAAAAGAG